MTVLYIIGNNYKELLIMKVTKRIEHRHITEEEFVKQKNDAYFSELRQIGKSTNFLMIFGGSPKVFVESALETRWSEAQVDQFVKDNHLEDTLERLQELYVRESPLKLKFLAVAKFIQDGFFSLYKGLAKRIEANRQFAKQHGYVRGIFGATRKLIEEFLEGSHDRKLRGAFMRNLDNICANTDIQNLEAAVVNLGMIEVADWIEKNNKDIILWNNVHDSADFYVHKKDLAEFCKTAERIFTQDRPELKGVPLAIDFTICDLTQGDYYKHGRSLANFVKE